MGTLLRRTVSEKKLKKESYSFVIGAGETSQVASIVPSVGVKGEVLKLIIVIPNWTNTVTAVVSLNNADEKEVFASDPMAQNDEYDITMSRSEAIIASETGEEFKITLSGVPGGTGGTVTVTAYVGG